MATIFMTFIGTGNYESVNYVLGGESAKNRFVCKALLDIYQKQGADFDKLFFFLTDKAKELNWDAYTRTDRNTGELIKDEGIQPFLEERFPGRYEQIRIPDGNSDAELLEIFDKIYSVIEPGDHLTIDTTHGFRSLPLLYFPVLRYARELKNITIEHIYYGCFLPKQPDAPVIDLRIYDMMLDYAGAAHLFVKTGNAGEMSEQIKSYFDQLPPEKKGSMGIAKDLGKDMGKLTHALLTCKGGETAGSIKPMIDSLFRRKNKLQAISIPEAKLFTQLLEHAIDSAGSLYEAADPVEMGLYAVEWYLQRGLIVQGYTALRESITTFFCRMYVPSVNYLNKVFREELDNVLTGSICRGGSKPTRESALQAAKELLYLSLDEAKLQEKELLEKKDAFLAGIVQLICQIDYASGELDFIKQIIDNRNSMNHFGMGVDNPDVTGEKLQADYERVVALFESFRARSSSRISAEEALELLGQTGSGFVNFSNHASSDWSEAQRAAALELSGGGTITDLPFPQISGAASEETLQETAADYIAQIQALRPAAVMCMGETGCSFLVASALKAQGIPVYYACSDRESVETVTENGTKKSSVFRFVRFRSY